MELKRDDDSEPGATRPERRSGSTDRTRRTLLLGFPAAVLALIAATVSAAAFKFLRPRRAGEAGGAGRAGEWSPVAPLSEIGGTDPVARKVSVRREAGWASEVSERTVFVLPGSVPRVVSSVCPHEGCEVVWDAAAKSFLCPCHDSTFDAAGARLEGPAAHGLDELPARVEGGVLQVQYRAAAPGTPAPREDQTHG